MNKLKYAKSCDVEKEKVVCIEHGNKNSCLKLMSHPFFKRKYSKHFIFS